MKHIGYEYRTNFTYNDIPYQCYFPNLVKIQNETREEEYTEHPSQYLKSLKGICAHGQDGWWTYDLCFGDHIRQYRPHTENIIIGKVPKHSYMEENYYAEVYEDGAFCDEAGHKRIVEARYRCSLDTHTPIIEAIKEPVMCLYYLEVLTDKLCQHPKYRKEKPVTQTVMCFSYIDASKKGPDMSHVLNAQGGNAELLKDRQYEKRLKMIRNDLMMDIDQELIKALLELF